MKRAVFGGLALAGAALALSGCDRQQPVKPPPRATDRFDIPAWTSIVAVPVSVDLSRLKDALEDQIPHTLYSLNRKDQTCIASKKVKLLIVKVKTPRIKCDIVGNVTRGKAVMTGKGQDILVTFPVHAVVYARDIAGILKQETATADATVRARIRLTLDQNWNPHGAVDIHYDWTDSPHIEFLGQRIDFTKDADAKLKPVVARLERHLPQELARLNLRRDIAKLWRSAFTTLELNEANPPVWMRVTPEQLQYGGYSLSRQRLTFNIGMRARTETFVGRRPSNPAAAPLPPMHPLEAPARHFAFFIPVISDYQQLEPVVQRALVKRSRRPFTLPGIGDVDARFGPVTLYGTTGGRIAAGVRFVARTHGGQGSTARGQVWLTGYPVNAPNSRKVRFARLNITGDTDNKGADLMLALANSPGFSQTIADALAQNFEHDFDKLIGKIERALDDKRVGDLILHAKIDHAVTGQLKASGQGLYLPVRGSGTASITLAPN